MVVNVQTLRWYFNSISLENLVMQSYKFTSITNVTTNNELIENSFFTSSDWFCFDQKRSNLYHDYYVNSLYKGVVDIEPAEGNVCMYKAISFGNKQRVLVTGKFNDNTKFTEFCYPSERLKEHTIQLAKTSLIIGYCKNYYHFVFDILTRIFAVDFIDEKLTLITSSLAEKNSFQQQWLDIISPDFNIIKIPPLNKVNFIGKIVYANTRSNDTLGFSKGPRLNLLWKFRDYILGKYQNIESSFPKKFFITRDPNEYEARSLLAENDVFNFLKSKAYVAINPDNLSVHEQVILFSNATHIVGFHGAAFANTLFCSDNCRLYEIIDHRIDERFNSFNEIKDYVSTNFWGRFHQKSNVDYKLICATDIEFFIL